MGFSAVEIDCGHPSGDLSALPPDIAAAADPLLDVFKRKGAPLPLDIYGFLRPVTQANELDAFVVIEAEEIGVSIRGATHAMRPGLLSVIITDRTSFCHRGLDLAGLSGPGLLITFMRFRALRLRRELP